MGNSSGKYDDAPPLGSVPAVTAPPAPAPPLAASTSTRNNALDEFMNSQSYIEEIRRLEAEVKFKQAEVARLQTELRQAQHQHSQVSQQLVVDHKRQRAELKADLEARNEDEVGLRFACLNQYYLINLSKPVFFPSPQFFDFTFPWLGGIAEDCH